VLAAVGVITSSQPAKDAWADQTRGIILERTVADLRLRLRLDPGVPGANHVTLQGVEARTGTPVDGAEKVALIFSMVDMDMGVNEVPLASQGNGVYATDTGIASMVGTWHAEALVRRAGRDEVRSTFEFPLADQALPGGVTQGRPGQGAPGQGIGLATPVAPAAARFLNNSVPPNEASLATGEQLYTQNCMVCRGVDGKGDGPAARALRSPPANLTVHVPLHTEGELWWWITNGIAGTQMPAWKNTLSDAERWTIVTYLEARFGSQ
jgi:mono/diheme cytochrome c family protein